MYFSFCPLENMNITMYTKTHLYEKFGHVFYNVTNVRVEYKISGLKLRLDNLFDGVKVLGRHFFQISIYELNIVYFH